MPNSKRMPAKSDAVLEAYRDKANRTIRGIAAVAKCNVYTVKATLDKAAPNWQQELQTRRDEYGGWGSISRRIRAYIKAMGGMKLRVRTLADACMTSVENVVAAAHLLGVSFSPVDDDQEARFARIVTVLHTYAAPAPPAAPAPASGAFTRLAAELQFEPSKADLRAVLKRCPSLKAVINEVERDRG